MFLWSVIWEIDLQALKKRENINYPVHSDDEDDDDNNHDVDDLSNDINYMKDQNKSMDISNC